MTRIGSRASELRRGFLFHLGAFLVLNAAHGGFAHRVWRRGTREDEAAEPRRRLFAPSNPLE
jgi:hypothetical protein